MNDYQIMRKYLESLDEDGLATVLLKTGVDTYIHDDKVVEVLEDADGGAREVPRSRWKKATIEDLLRLREGDQTEWNSLCFAVGITPDDAAHLSLTRINVLVGWIALFVASTSLVWQIINAVG